VAIRLTLALTFFNFLGANAARVLLTLYALELDAPASAVGVIGGLLYLFPLLLSWPIVFGFVGTALGLPPVFWINAALMVCGGLLSLSQIKRFPGRK
jgi:hypothetical protein